MSKEHLTVIGMIGENGSMATATPEEIAIGGDGKRYVRLNVRSTDDEASEAMNSYLEENMGPSVPPEKISRGTKSFSMSGRWNSNWNPKGPKAPWKNAKDN